MLRLQTRFEVGQMASKYFPPAWARGVYLALVLYLYGTLAVYAISVPTSMQKMGWGADDNMTHYYVYAAIFGIVVLPLGFGSFENTKPVQVLPVALGAHPHCPPALPPALGALPAPANLLPCSAAISS